MTRRSMLTLFQILVSLGCLGWLWSRPEIHQGLLSALSQASLAWILVGIVLAGLVIGFGIVRWRLFLRLQGIHISWWDNAKLSLIGAFFNLILVGTVGGDAVKVLYLIRRFPNKQREAIVSILMDHLCGLPAVVVMYAIFCLTRWEWLAGSGISSQLALFAGVYLGASVIGITLLLLLAVSGLCERSPEGLPLRDQAIKFSKTLVLFIRHWPITLSGVALSFVIHWLYFGTFFAASEAMRAQVALFNIFTIMPVVDVITTLPVSVSGIGIRETLFESFLNQLCQVSSEIGVMISLLGFGFSAFWSLLGGLLFPFYRPASPDGTEVGLRDVMTDARHARDDDDARVEVAFTEEMPDPPR
ncbi:MAG: uncharacterized membrane protein YbhN (UPF0104 family) [Verrucomicrobiales bacterium]|jgi:uncharacterized membrane protein YbhN (UPF0104 family)